MLDEEWDAFLEEWLPQILSSFTPAQLCRLKAQLHESYRSNFKVIQGGKA